MYWCVLVLALALALTLALLLLLFAVVAIVIVCVFSLQQINEHCCANYTTIQLYPPNFQRLALLRCCDVVNSSAMIGKVPKCVSRTVCNVAESQHIKL